jgi:hypothetical protein
MEEGFAYQPDKDNFICRGGRELVFSKLILKKGTGYYRLYTITPGACKGCDKRGECETTNRSVRINASPY